MHLRTNIDTSEIMVGIENGTDLTTSARPKAFARRFAVVAAILFGLYCFPYAEFGIQESLFKQYLEGYARGVAWVIRAFDPQVAVSGNVITGRFSMAIVKSCDAMEAMLLFCAATLAFPGRLVERAAAALLGILLLAACNVVRLASLYAVGVYFPSTFETPHLEVWPLVLVAVAATEFWPASRWLARRPVSARARA